MVRITLLILIALSLGCTAPTAQSQNHRPKLISSGYLISNPNIKIKFQPPAPPYPTEAKINRIMGDVVIIVKIDNEGVPKSARAKSGPKELFQTAELYIMKMRFSNTSQPNSQLDTTFEFTMAFRLR